MKDIQVWSVDEQSGDVSATPCEPVNRADTEKKLEDLLVKMPQLLGDVLLVGRQTTTEGGPLDLLGVDAEGRLVVFELKRGTLTRDAVAQVVDYVSFLAEQDPASLARHIESRSGVGGIEKIENFEEWYQEQFSGDLAHPPRAVLVGLGVDDATRRMVDFLAASGMDISLLTFHAFKTANGVPLLAKQVEVAVTPKPIASRKGTRGDNQQLLDQLATRMGLRTWFEDVRTACAAAMAAHVWPHATCYALNFIETSNSGNPTYRKYLGLHLDEQKAGVVTLVWEARSVTDKTASIIAETTMRVAGHAAHVDPDTRFSVPLTEEQWSATKPAWLKVCEQVKAVYRDQREAQPTAPVEAETA